MLGGLIKGLIGFFSASEIGHKIGTVVTDGAALLALAPLGIWLLTHKDESAVCVTYGQLAFFGLLLLFVLKVAHYTRAGRPQERGNDLG